MKNRFPTFFRRWVFSVILSLLSTAAQQSQAALYDEHPGSDVQVHYVHLTGYRSNPIANEAERRNLLKWHNDCVSSNQRLGKAYTALPPEGIPATLQPMDVEIYYASNRSLTVQKTTSYLIDVDSCALQEHPLHEMELLSAIGRCTIDLIKQTARGVCDAQAHARAPNTTLSNIPPDTLPAAELNKLPPSMRAQVVARFEQTKRSMLALTGEIKTIAGYRCEVRRNTVLDIDKCMSNPPSPFPIPASYNHQGLPGLLLEIKSPQLMLKAQEVRMGLGVSQSIFMLPAGLRVRSVASPGVHP